MARVPTGRRWPAGRAPPDPWDLARTAAPALLAVGGGGGAEGAADGGAEGAAEDGAAPAGAAQGAGNGAALVGGGWKVDPASIIIVGEDDDEAGLVSSSGDPMTLNAGDGATGGSSGGGGGAAVSATPGPPVGPPGHGEAAEFVEEVVHEFVEEVVQLGTWVAKVRAEGAAGRIPQERRAQLDAIGFTWLLK